LGGNQAEPFYWTEENISDIDNCHSLKRFLAHLSQMDGLPAPA
jgi:hypothetical protein